MEINHMFQNLASRLEARIDDWQLVYRWSGEKVNSLAKASPWTSDWTAGIDLGLINPESELTCMRHRGGFIVDLMFGIPGVARTVSGWHAMAGVKILSDHWYIRMVLSVKNAAAATPRHHWPSGSNPPHRWTLRRLDRDALILAALVVTWLQQEARLTGLKDEVNRISSPGSVMVIRRDRRHKVHARRQYTHKHHCAEDNSTVAKDTIKRPKLEGALSDFSTKSMGAPIHGDIEQTPPLGASNH